MQMMQNSLTKEVKCFLIMRHRERKLEKMEDLQCSWRGRITLHKWSYYQKQPESQRSSTGIPNNMRQRTTKEIQIFLWEQTTNKRANKHHPRIVEVLHRKNTAEGNDTMPQFKLQYEATDRTRHEDRRNRAEDTEINSSEYGHLILEKSVKTLTSKNPHHQTALVKLGLYLQKNKLDPHLLLCTKINSKCIKDLSLNPSVLEIGSQRIQKPWSCAVCFIKTF